MRKNRPFLATASCLSGLLVASFLLFPWTIHASDYENRNEFPHIVSPGECLSRIARHYLPLTEAYTISGLVREIMERNGLDGTMIRPNQRLLIPLAPPKPPLLLQRYVFFLRPQFAEHVEHDVRRSHI